MLELLAAGVGVDIEDTVRFSVLWDGGSHEGAEVDSSYQYISQENTVLVFIPIDKNAMSMYFGHQFNKAHNFHTQSVT